MYALKRIQEMLSECISTRKDEATPFVTSQEVCDRIKTLRDEFNFAVQAENATRLVEEHKFLASMLHGVEGDPDPTILKEIAAFKSNRDELDDVISIFAS